MNVAAIGAVSMVPTGAGASAVHSSERGSTAERDPRRQEQEVARLRAIDQRVRAHEQAHAAVGGRYAGSPSFTYERGPNGVQYAVAGEVSIDTGPVANDPAATINKMNTVEAAALAPMDPSTADRQIAAKARQERLQAERELLQQTMSDAPERGLFVDLRV